MPNPNKNIPYTYYQDIQIPNVDLQGQLQNLFATGNYQLAINILNQNPQLDTKAYVANVINQIVTGVSWLESQYDNKTTVYMSQLATQYQTLIDQFINKANWSAQGVYDQFNFVEYNNLVYMALQDDVPVGTEPTDTTYWLELGLRGEQGVPGVNTTMKFSWDNTVTYQPNDIVVYDGNMYVALLTNTGVNPSGANASQYWMLFIGIERGEIYVGSTAPANPVNDTVWIRTPVDVSTVQAGTNVVGTFVRYVATSGTWEEMWPNVYYTWVGGYELYRTKLVALNFSITALPWSYTYSNLGTNSLVNIIPNGNLNATQANIYNNMSISISGTTITLTGTVGVSTALPIRMLII